MMGRSRSYAIFKVVNWGGGGVLSSFRAVPRCAFGSCFGCFSVRMRL